MESDAHEERKAGRAHGGQRQIVGQKGSVKLKDG